MRINLRNERRESRGERRMLRGYYNIERMAPKSFVLLGVNIDGGVWVGIISVLGVLRDSRQIC